MTILTAPARKSKSKAPREFSCSIVALTLEISDTRYAADEIPAGEFGSKAFRLSKHSGNHEVYDVIRTHAGIVECSCPDYIARHQGNGHGVCKHGRALVTLGLLPAPNDAPLPAPLRDVTNGFPQPDERQDVATAADLPIKGDVAPPLACCPAEAAEPCGSCVGDVTPGHDAPDPDDVEADPASWNVRWDADVWTTTEPEGDDDHLRNAAGGDISTHYGILMGFEPTPDRLTLHDLVERQRLSFESWRNDVGQLLADHLGELLSTLKLTSATTPAEYRDRAARLEESLRDTWQEIGRQSCACQHEPAGSAWGHPA